MALHRLSECLECPLDQPCWQWKPPFDKEKCNVYHARNVTREQVWFKNIDPTEPTQAEA